MKVYINVIGLIIATQHVAMTSILQRNQHSCCVTAEVKDVPRGKIRDASINFV